MKLLQGRQILPHLILGGTYQLNRCFMNGKSSCSSVLKLLESCELAGITFLRGYIQFLFDGPILNAYTLPQVTIANAILSPDSPGYRDALCAQIGKTVAVADEELNQRIFFQFCDRTVISISLREEDRVCVEAAMLQADAGKQWNVW